MPLQVVLRWLHTHRKWIVGIAVSVLGIALWQVWGLPVTGQRSTLIVTPSLSGIARQKWEPRDYLSYALASSGLLIVPGVVTWLLLPANAARETRVPRIAWFAALIPLTMALAILSLVPLELSGLWYALAYKPDDTPPGFINMTGVGPPRRWLLAALWSLWWFLLAALTAPVAVRLERLVRLCLWTLLAMLLVAVTWHAARQVQTYLYWELWWDIPWHRNQYSAYGVFWTGRLLVAASFLGMMAGILCRIDPHVSPNECRRCGYDLRGSSSGTCPECGETAAADLHS